MQTALIDHLLAWAGPSSLMGREKPSKSKGLNTLHPRRAGRWCIFNRGHCCSSPTYKCPWEESSTKTKFNWNFQPTAVSLVSFCMVLVKSPGWWCCLCSVVRLPKVFLLDAVKSWFDAVRSTWSFICYLLPVLLLLFAIYLMTSLTKPKYGCHRPVSGCTELHI